MTTQFDRKAYKNNEEDGLTEAGWVDVKKTRGYGA